MQHMRTISFALLLSGCNPGSFQDYLDTAPIRVSPAPARFKDANFGLRMVALNTTLDGVPVGRVVASGGASTPLAFIRSYTDGKISEGSFLRCKTSTECGGASDIGATIIPFERWGTGTTDARQACVFAPANATESTAENDPRLGGNGYVACEAPSNRPQSFTLGTPITDVRGADDATLRYSGFGLPSDHPLGVLLVGVHSLDNRTSETRNGGLYALPDLVYSDEQSMNIVPFLQLVQLLDPTTGENFSKAEDASDFGAVVVGVAEGKELTVAIAQPSKQRVIVARYDDTAGGEPLSKLRVHACVEGTTPGFGQTLALGDLSGDGAPELIVGSDEPALLIYDGRSMPGPASDGSCPDWDAAPAELPCSEGQGPSCDGFGASLAVGDVDADGTGDLIVGAPLATVDGKAEVGAVWVVPGSADGADVERAVAIVVPRDKGARFGWNVAALHTKDRDEPVASAPGVGEVFTVMCTPLESGFGGDALCLD